jgi:hypothetical protein
VLTVAVPVFVLELPLVTIYSLLLRAADSYHIWVFGAAAVVLVSAVAAMGLGASVGAALLLVAPRPRSLSSPTRRSATDTRSRL